MQPINLWLDDIRDPPGYEWVWAKTESEAVAALKTGRVQVISLDNDLGEDDKDPNFRDEDAGEGIGVFNAMDAMVSRGTIPLPVIIIHTRNPKAREYMTRGRERLLERMAQFGD